MADFLFLEEKSAATIRGRTVRLSRRGDQSSGETFYSYALRRVIVNIAASSLALAGESTPTGDGVNRTGKQQTGERCNRFGIRGWTRNEIIRANSQLVY